MPTRTFPRRVNSYDRDAVVPPLGSRWEWEPRRPHARERITVVNVLWNGEEWWVQTRSDPRPCVSFVTGRRYADRPGALFWNDLSRFWEAVGPC